MFVRYDTQSMDTKIKIDSDIPSDGEPKKVIRTFAGDMHSIKEEKTPNLIPFKKSQASPRERIIGRSAVTQIPIPVPIKTSGIDKVQKNDNIIVPKKQNVSSQLETYSGDFSDQVKKTNASRASILATEQNATTYTKPKNPTVSKNNNIWYILVGGILLLVGGVIVYMAYSQYGAKTVPVIVAPTISAPIFIDSREQVSGTGIALLQEIEQSVTKPLAINKIRMLFIKPTSYSSGNVFTQLKLNAPNRILRNIITKGGVAGIINTRFGNSPFFIIPVDSYGPTFASMLSWEPRMQTDLSKLFPMPQNKTLTSGTTTPAVAHSGFRDEVVSNHNARVYRNAQGTSVLVYGYWNPTTLIIARNPSAFAEIIARLATARTQ